MQNIEKLITSFLIMSIVIGIVAYFILGFLFSLHFIGVPGVPASQEAQPIIATGIAAMAFTILFMMYPVVKFGVKNDEGDDFR